MLHFNGNVYCRPVVHCRLCAKINAAPSYDIFTLRASRQESRLRCLRVTIGSVVSSNATEAHKCIFVLESQRVCAHRSEAENNQLNRWKKSFTSIVAEICQFSFKARRCGIINHALTRNPPPPPPPVLPPPRHSENRKWLFSDTKTKQHTATVQQKRKKIHPNKYKSNFHNISMKRSCSVQ